MMVACRTCLVNCEAEVSKNLYMKLPEDSGFSCCVADILTEVAHVQVMECDTFSEMICDQCYGELCNAQSFIRKAQASDRTMRGVSHLLINDNDDASNKLISTLNPNISDSEGNYNNKIVNETSLDSSNKGCEFDMDVSPSDVNLEISNVTSLSVSHRVGELPQQGHNESLDSDYRHIDTIDSDVHVKMEMLEDYEIKQEPNADESIEAECVDDYYSNENGMIEENDIKIEDSMENIAMHDHQHSDCDENRPPPDNNSVYPYMNGHSDGNNEDLKPTEEELKAYASKLKLTKTCNSDSEQTNLSVTCEQCGMVLASKYAKYRHMKLHKAVLTHCILCSEVFKTRKTLKKHVIKAHSYGEPLPCEICNTSFTTLEELTLHKSVHMLIRPDLKCIVCSQANFSSTKQLKIHMHRHKSIPIVKQLSCQPCNKIFLNKFTLKAHRKNNCPASGNYKKLNNSAKANGDDTSDVKSAIKIEKQDTSTDGKKGSLRCALCPRTFMSEYARTIHMEQHKMTKFPCHICKIKFKRKDHLARHMSATHGEESDEDYA